MYGSGSGRDPPLPGGMPLLPLWCWGGVPPPAPMWKIMVVESNPTKKQRCSDEWALPDLEHSNLMFLHWLHLKQNYKPYANTNDFHNVFM